MLCRRPILVKGLTPVPCGQCMPCRINKRRVWSTRMMLELRQHWKAAFITLTYAPENLPDKGSLVKRDMQLWLKRVRAAVAPIELRYFLVGEYGDRTNRPHYHAIVYGLGREDQELVEKTWGLGYVYIGDVTEASCQYVAGYVTKKCTSIADKRLLPGQVPEFSLMSRNPGIGSRAAEQIATQITRNRGGAMWITKNGDVPGIARMEGGFWPLGRYMIGKIRLGAGFVDEENKPSGNSPPAKRKEREAEMRALRDSNPLAFKTAKPFVDWNKSDRKVYTANLRKPQRTL
ncbi:replication initiator protein [robinz microvirus RP_133]|nr:replication initiator protein [robinz microvirus RP_133]